MKNNESVKIATRLGWTITITMNDRIGDYLKVIQDGHDWPFPDKTETDNEILKILKLNMYLL